MNVLMICPFASPNIGGVETHLSKLTDYLVKKDHFVYLLTYQPLTTKARGPALEKHHNLEIHRVSWFGYNLFPKLEPYFPLVLLYLVPGLLVKSLVFYVKHHQEVDVIHAHGFAAALVVKIISKIYPKRTVVSTHAVYSLKNRKLLAFLVKFLLQSFDAVLAVGEPSRQELIAIGLLPTKVKVHPNWVDLQVFKPVGREEVKRDLVWESFASCSLVVFWKRRASKFYLRHPKNFLTKLTSFSSAVGNWKMRSGRQVKGKKTLSMWANFFKINRKSWKN